MAKKPPATASKSIDRATLDNVFKSNPIKENTKAFNEAMDKPATITTITFDPSKKTTRTIKTRSKPMSTAAKPLTTKQVFKNIKPVESKNVEVYFDKAFKVNPRTKFDGYMKKLGDRMGVFVRVPGHGDDIFAVPYSCPAGVRSQQMEGSLRGALRTRKLEVVRIDDLKPKKK